MGKFFGGIFVSFALILCIGLPIYFGATPSGKATWNNWWHDVVEETCRSMISSYNADNLTYEQYKDSTSELEQSWANSAKIRANQTASTYNNYIINNSYVWKDNVPNDIYMQLAYLQ